VGFVFLCYSHSLSFSCVRGVCLSGIFKLISMDLWFSPGGGRLRMPSQGLLEPISVFNGFLENGLVCWIVYLEVCNGH
jgi:hypothetical protein